jgi:spermidine synthase
MNDPLPLVGVAESNGLRHLQLGTQRRAAVVQGSMRVAQPTYLENEWARRLLAALLWLDPQRLDEGHAVHLGMGAGTLARFTHRELGMPTTVVEINPHVIEACRRFFLLEPDARLQIFRADAGPWLKGCPKERIKLLVVDLYDEQARGPVFDDEAFYADCRAVLQRGGVMAMNLFGGETPATATLARVAAVFGAGQVWSLVPSPESNIAVIAAREATLPDPAALLERALELNRRFDHCGLRARHWPRLLRPYTG